MGAEDIDRLLDAKTVAVVGLSNNPARDSHRIAAYLQEHGYRVVPVNPNETEILGEKAYATVADIPFDIDIVDIFRRREFLKSHVQQAIEKGAWGAWGQLGVADTAAEKVARDAGLAFVMNRCIMVEHDRRRG
ncbi:MAG TPA: CoA-binding protein [Candidatus Dormibacteraeota bacterium]|nr:CoA-binding protein [Candidatus Dormibacteraeota bacterium]